MDRARVCAVLYGGLVGCSMGTSPDVRIYRDDVFCRGVDDDDDDDDDDDARAGGIRRRAVA